jgi:NADPH:quinone reductase-like Zn-dependent oxidoreductase
MSSTIASSPERRKASRSVRAFELHPRDGFDALQVVTRVTPAIGRGDVRVRMEAVSLNNLDLVMAREAKDRTTPIIPMSDGAGVVIEVGAEVTRLTPGDRVAASFFPTWVTGSISAEHHANVLGVTRDGVLADEVVLPETAWVRVPAHLSFEQAATLPCAGVTAYNALFEAARLRPGDVVLTQGTGGVAMFVLQLAKVAGARVVVTSSSGEKCALARKLGADCAIDSTASPRWSNVVREWTDGRGADIVIDLGGPGTFDQSVASLRSGGTLVLLGVLAGHQGTLDWGPMLEKMLSLRGVYVGSIEMFEALNRVMAAHRIEPVIDRTFAFDETRAACEYLASGKHVGKVVIRLGETPVTSG